MKETLLKSVFGIVVLGIAASAHATSYTLTDNTFPGPSLNPGDVASFSDLLGPSVSFTDNWEFALNSNSGLGGLVTNDVVTVGMTTIFDISPLTVKLYAATSGGLITGPVLESGKTINLASLLSGNYDLVIAGTTTGTGGGLYDGYLTTTAVPLPAAAWLLLSGLAGVGAMARRRKNEQRA